MRKRKSSKRPPPPLSAVAKKKAGAESLAIDHDVDLRAALAAAETYLATFDEEDTSDARFGPALAVLLAVSGVSLAGACAKFARVIGLMAEVDHDIDLRALREAYNLALVKRQAAEQENKDLRRREAKLEEREDELEERITELKGRCGMLEEHIESSNTVRRHNAELEARKALEGKEHG